MSRVRSIRLDWAGEGLVFEGTGASGVPITIDGDSVTGTTPMETLLFALAGCMAVDVLVILEKSRVPVHGLSITAEGLRAESAPKRYESVKLDYVLDGPEAEHQGKLDRAIELSREKYCSVLHTLRSDLELEITARVATPGATPAP